MNKIKLCFALSACLIFLNNPLKVRAQDNQNPESNLYLGLGLGMDYGGIGIKAEYLPHPYVGIFGGLGYNIQSLGFNFGASFKALPHSKFTPVVQAMYGYNAVIYIKGASEYNKSYYGPSIGAGLDWKVGRKNNKIYAAIFYPFRTSRFHDDYDALKANPTVNFDNEITPVTFSFGFNWAIQKGTKKRP